MAPKKNQAPAAPKKNQAPAKDNMVGAQEKYDIALSALNEAKTALESATPENKELLQKEVDEKQATLNEAEIELNEAKDKNKNSNSGAFVVKANLKHNGTRYNVWDTIEVDGDEAQILLDNGTIE